MTILKQDVRFLPASQVELSVSVSCADVQEERKRLIEAYSRRVSIKGFRKGHVPASLIEQRYAAEIHSESLENLIQEALREIFVQIEERPLVEARPTLRELPSWKEGEDFSFSLVYDIYPRFKAPSYQGFHVTVPEVVVDEASLLHHLDHLREHHATLVAKEDKALATQGDIAVMDFVELDENHQALENTRRSGLSCTLGRNENIYHFDDAIEGHQVGDVWTVTKDYPADFPYEELASTQKTLSLTLKALQELQLPELNDAFAASVDEAFKTLDDLKEQLKKDMEQQLKKRLEEDKLSQFFDQILPQVNIDLPESMIDAAFADYWSRLAAQSRMSVEQLDEILASSREDMKKAWLEDGQRNLRKELLLVEWIRQEAIEISPEELEEEWKRQAARYAQSVDFIKEHFQKNRLVESVVYSLKVEKISQKILQHTQVSVLGKKTFNEYTGHNHPTS